MEYAHQRVEPGPWRARARHLENDQCGVRRVDPAGGAPLETLQMPAGTGMSSLESDGGERFFCDGGGSGKITTIRRPR